MRTPIILKGAVIAALAASCTFAAARPTAVSTGDLQLRGDSGLATLQQYSAAGGTVRLDATGLGTIDLPYLSGVTGDLILENVSARRIDLRRLRTVGGTLRIIGAQSPVSGEAVGMLPVPAPGADTTIGREAPSLLLQRLESVGADVVVEGLATVVQIRTDSLKKVAGALTVRGNEAATGLDLSALTEAGELTIRANRVLERVDLSSLTRATRIKLRDNRRLLGVDARSLDVVDGEFAMTGNRDLIALRLDGLSAVGAAGSGDLVVTDSGALQQAHFPALTTVAGELVLSRLSNLVRVELESLEEVGGALDLRSNPALADVLVGAVRLGGGIDFEQSRAVTSISLPRLAWVGGDLIFGSMLSSLPRLAHLELPMLAEIGGRLAVYDTALVRLSLDSLQRAGSLTIERNPGLRQLALPKLREVGRVRIARNALAQCLVDAIEAELGAVAPDMSLHPDNKDCGRSLVSAQALAEAVESTRGGFEQCLRDSGLVGTLDPGDYSLELSWTVAKAGGVTGARVDNPEALRTGPASACVTALMHSWQFPVASRELEITRHPVTIPVRVPWRTGSKIGSGVVEAAWGVAPAFHEHGITAAQFSGDGRYVLTASLDHTLRLWDAASQRILAVLRGHGGPVRAAAFSPDGKHVVSGSEDRTVRVWTIDGGREVARMSMATEVESLAVGPDQALYVGGRDGAVGRWSLAAAQPLAATGDARFVGNVFSFETWDEPLEVTGISLDGAGKRMAVTSEDGRVQLIPLDEGEPILLARPAGVFARINSVAISEDGDYVATAGGGSGGATVRVWNASDGSLAVALPLDEQLYAVRFSADSKLLYATGDTGVRSWRVGKWTPDAFIGPIDDGATAAAWSPDARLIVVGGSRGKVEFWDAKRRRPLRELSGHSSRVTALAAHGVADSIASASEDQTIRLWGIDGNEPSTTWVDSHNEVDGAVVALAMRDGIVLSGNEGGRLRLWQADAPGFAWQNRAHQGGVSVVAFSADGRQLLSAGQDGRVIIWDRQRRRIITAVTPHSGAPIRAAAMAPDGARVASVAAQGTILLWDTKTGDIVKVLEGHPDPVGLRFAMGGQVLVSAGGRSLKAWDLDSGALLGTLGAHGREVFDLDVSSDGRQAASVGLDGVLRLWDLEARRQVRALDIAPVRGDYPTSVAFIDSDRLIVGKQDGRIIRVRLPRP